MRAEVVLERALSLLNYTDPTGRTDALQSTELLRRGMTAINTILTDILFVQRKDPVQLLTITDGLPVDDGTALGIMPYGVAMLLAQGENDGDSQQIFASLYNQKRNAVPRENGTRKNVIPVPRE